MKTITYTSTMSQDLWEKVNKMAKASGEKKKEIIERAIRKYLFEQKKRAYREGFAKMADDQEIVELAEMGMDDYSKQLEKY